MREILDSKLKAKLSVDENEKVRDILHLNEHWRSDKQDPLDVAIDYLQNVSKTFKLSAKLLKNISKTASFDEPKKQDVQYRLYKQKKLFDSTTVSFYQTCYNLPVWEAGLSITVEKNPSIKQGQKKISSVNKQKQYNVIHAVNTSQEGIDVKLPSLKTIIRIIKNYFTKLVNQNQKLDENQRLVKKNLLIS